MQYIYGLYSTKDYLKKNGEFNYFKIKYIGRTKNMDKRLSKHIKLKDKPNNSILSSWVKQVYQRHEIKIILLEECEDEKAVEREKYYINKFINNGLKNIISNPKNSPKHLRTSNIELFKENKQLKNYINNSPSPNIQEYIQTLPSQKNKDKKLKYYKNKIKELYSEIESLKDDIQYIFDEVKCLYQCMDSNDPSYNQIIRNMELTKTKLIAKYIGKHHDLDD